ncbi:MAG: N-acetylmuramoyl-L-alanine amidase [Flavobacteriaceae bacterium]|nr:N-acetylmuramoyl-L-alanine amidase [Flavobacteriaceae bacterium]
MAQYLQSRLGIHDRGIKQANFQVLRDTFGHYSSILLGTGFLSNDLEADHLLKKEGRSAIALALLQSLIKIFYHD